MSTESKPTTIKEIVESGSKCDLIKVTEMKQDQVDYSTNQVPHSNMKIN
jgi:hypothetical protein